MSSNMNLLRSGIKAVIGYLIAVFHSKAQQSFIGERVVTIGHYLVDNPIRSTSNDDSTSVIKHTLYKKRDLVKTGQPILNC